jgi:hypothetical protein
MKYIITETQYKLLIEDRTRHRITIYNNDNESEVMEWLNVEFGDLRIIERTSLPGSIFYVDKNGNVIFEFKPKPEKLLVSQGYVCGYLYNIFGMLLPDRNKVIREWFYKTYGLKPKLGFVDCSPFNSYGKIKFKQ